MSLALFLSIRRRTEKNKSHGSGRGATLRRTISNRAVLMWVCRCRIFQALCHMLLQGAIYMLPMASRRCQLVESVSSHAAARCPRYLRLEEVLMCLNAAARFFTRALQAFFRMLLQDALDMLLAADSALMYTGTTRTVEEIDEFCQIDDSAAKVCDDSPDKRISRRSGYRPIERERCRLTVTDRRPVVLLSSSPSLDLSPPCNIGQIMQIRGNDLCGLEGDVICPTCAVEDPQLTLLPRLIISASHGPHVR